MTPPRALHDADVPLVDLRWLSEWHEDHAEVLWFRVPVCEPPEYVGTPTSSGWPFSKEDEPTLAWVPMPRLSADAPPHPDPEPKSDA